MKKLLLIASILIGFNSIAQTTEAEKTLKTVNTDTTQGWKYGGVFGLNFSQVSLTNWAAGGQSSVSLNGLLDVFANYKKGNSAWDNNLTLGYGEVKQGDADWIKSDDRILFTSKYGRKATKNWYYAGLFNFKSQFAPGYSDPAETEVISDFMAPGYLLGAIGMDYKPNDNFTMFISPVTAKLTYVGIQKLADAGAFGVEAAEFDVITGEKTKDGENSRLEVGGYFRMLYKQELMKNVNFQTNLDVFSNYSEEPSHLDINWDNLLSMKVNKYITTTISTSLIYDHDIDITEKKSDGTDKLDESGNPIIGPRTQFKYVLAVGFQYKFGAK